MHVPGNPLISIIIELLIAVIVIYLQSVKRPIRNQNAYTLTIILAILGIYQTIPLLHNTPTSLIIVNLASLIVGAALGYLRGHYTTITRDNQTLYRRGNPITILIWVAGTALHIGLGALTGAISPAATTGHGTQFSSATVLIYLAITLAAQRYEIHKRAVKMASMG